MPGAYDSLARPERDQRDPAHAERGADRDWLRERLDLGHPGSHLVVEPARPPERLDVVGPGNADGLGVRPLAPTLTQCQVYRRSREIYSVGHADGACVAEVGEREAE
jgi:hypothetical protein